MTKKKKKSNNNWILALLLILLFFGIGFNQGWFQGMVVINNVNETTNLDDTTPVEQPDDGTIDCWWQQIDTYNGAIDENTRIEWKTFLVEGTFKFTWDFDDTADVEIVKDVSVVEYDGDTTSGNYQFASFGEQWGIAVSNDKLKTIDADLSLYQWICENDPQNYRPDLFNNPFMVAQILPTNEECNIMCSDFGYDFGGFTAGIMGCTGLTTMINNCCCYITQN